VPRAKIAAQKEAGGKVLK
jgi:hypothetical protein